MTVLTAAMLLCLVGGGGWLASLAGTRLAPTPATAAVATTAETQPRYVTKDIEDVRPGDLVLARDQHGRSIGYRPVDETYRRTSDHLRHLTFRASDGTE